MQAIRISACFVLHYLTVYGPLRVLRIARGGRAIDRRGISAESGPLRARRCGVIGARTRRREGSWQAIDHQSGPACA